ncbi:NAD-glutamate dehydrogenase [Spiribacter sp. C176]|uniref:NAD-glutamate dehydrogenase n=1 Tax=Spiribacter salilacus TaxID=2664894 RepID=A0A6N7QPL8_9GAMM|nr:NAD-glutamate dehydrogenase [Spiribacter salilacus]MRH78366.1 NAD-glutamate dehydrogenase [Spiribacter salilacus]
MKTDALIKYAKERWPAARFAVIRDFLTHYYSAVAPDDLASRETPSLYGAALSHWAMGEKRPRGKTQLHVYNPDAERNAWESTHTVIQLVTDDQPFLIDSLTMAINEYGLMIHMIVHPVLEVSRDAAHRITRVDADELGRKETEAWIHIEVDRQAETSQLNALKKVLESAIADVNAAVEDWKPMRQAAQRALRGLQRHPLPIGERNRDEVVAFLEWMLDDHFTFLGYRRYDLRQRNGKMTLKATAGSGLGLLREPSHQGQPSASFDALPTALREQARNPDPLIITKSSRRSTVHRRGYMDYIGVKRFNQTGEVIGEHRFLGLYTSAAYSRNPRQIPLLRRKVEAVLTRAGLRRHSHAGKALAHILETFPRDELFQIEPPTLHRIAVGILHLQERQRVRLFVRHDTFGRFVSCLIYAPRDRYDTAVRKRMQDILMTAFGGAHSEFTVQLSEAVLARIHFVIHLGEGAPDTVDHAAVEDQLAQTTRAWSDDLDTALLEHFGEARGTALAQTYTGAFSAAYREDTSPRTAAQDIARLEPLTSEQPLAISLYRPLEAPENIVRLKLYHVGEPIGLSEVLPVLEQLGMRVIDERPYGIHRRDQAVAWIHDFGLSHESAIALDSGELRDTFQTAFAAIWHNKADSDGFNRLILLAGLDWREVLIMRSYAQYLRQAGTSYSQPYIEDTLATHPDITRKLIALFHAQFAPDTADEAVANTLSAEIEAQLDDVESLDDDRILRRFLAAINATLRTNYYRVNETTGEHREFLSFKLQPSAIPDIPKPVPAFEIFVTSPRMEGVHLRGGKVARGGLRWSDRREDYRTEVLGLMKAQMVKNAVIVPVGAKGGFVCKQLPKQRQDQPAEVLACYRLFIQGLLDITDNIIDACIVPPPQVTRRDEDDPYLVVAADKGTATFSDEANALAEAYNFWLHDAFASGGSTGYDHKGMAITARGAWVAVQRHFRELGRDIQTTPVSVVGIGDMSGDVFGNGMLQSRTIRLIAAFDHRHIFIDPDPDPATTYAERERLFQLPRSSWEDYDESLISPGGGVWPRTAKSIRLSAAVRAALAIDAERLTPNELISAILKAPVDLLWNGGIGTYIKSSDESHADVGDKANDAVRVDADALRCQVIGEGGNLGITALGRVAFAANGGLINSDAIDNSGGVDCSDHEVNIKILLNGVVDDGDLTVKQRNRLLVDMTDEVAQLVLANNYRQTQAISLMFERASVRLDEQARYLRALEREGQLDRAVEQLPDDEILAERQQQGRGLTRPELSILLAYAKIQGYEALLESDLVTGTENLEALLHYFPSPLRERFAKRIDEHPLRQEIIASDLINHVLNRMGATFLMRISDSTGVSLTEAIRAYLATRDIHGLRGLWHEVDALDNHIPAQAQHALLHEMGDLQERGTLWLLRHCPQPIEQTQLVNRMQPPIAQLAERLPEFVAETDLAWLEERYARLSELGLSKSLATRLARLPMMATAFDVHEASQTAAASLETTARVHFGAANALDLNRLREALGDFTPADNWQTRHRRGLLEALFSEHRRLTESILTGSQKKNPAERIADWMEANQDRVEFFKQTTEQIASAAQPDLTMLSVAVEELRQLTAGGLEISP